jgi:hypothetical protein
MKTAPTAAYIDYWDRGLWCFGIRVWPNECKAIANDPGELPDKMVAIEPPCQIPLNPQALPNGVLKLSVVAHMAAHPGSDLLGLVTGKTTFEQARSNAKSSY